MKKTRYASHKRLPTPHPNNGFTANKYVNIWINEEAPLRGMRKYQTKTYSIYAASFIPLIKSRKGHVLFCKMLVPNDQVYRYNFIFTHIKDLTSLEK